MSRRSSRVLTKPPSTAASTTNLSTMSEQKIIRRKLLDAKSELKNQIFGMHQNPEMLDYPTRLTSLMLDRVTKTLDVYEEYYKTKGLRVTTRPNILLETFERTIEKVRVDMIEYESKAISKTNESFEAMRGLINRTEKLYCALPKIMFDYFNKREIEKTKKELSGILLRRQKLMDAYEEAKNEHFESIRINIGHPSYAQQLVDLQEREEARLIKHKTSVKEQAETMVNKLNSMTVEVCKSIQTLTQSYFSEFDSIPKLSDIMPSEFRQENSKNLKVDSNGRKWISWGELTPAGLPNFPTEHFHSKRESSAHHELATEKELLLTKTKNFYRAEMLDIGDTEKRQLFEIDRWKTYWELQISEIKSCFED